MSDTRAAIRELRSLSEKRSTQGLTEHERSRLAELRERLGLPSEPAEVRAGGPQPGGTAAPTPVPPSSVAPRATAASAPTANAPPLAPAALPRLDAAEPTPLPGLDLTSPPTSEPAAPPLELAPLDAADVLAPVALAAAEPLPELGPDVAEVDDSGAVPFPADAASPEWDAPAAEDPPAASWDATTDPAIEMGALEASAAPAEPLPELSTEAPPGLEPGPTLSDLEAQEALQELELTAAESGSAGAEPVMEAVELPADAPQWDAMDTAEPLDTGNEAASPDGPLPFPPEPTLRPRSLAERIDAAVEESEPGGGGEEGTAEEQAWGAEPLATEAGASEELGSLPLVPEDLGATPLVPEEVGSLPLVPEDLGAAPLVPEEVGSLPLVPEDLGAAPLVPEEVGAVSLVPEDLGAAPLAPEDLGATPLAPEDLGAAPLAPEELAATPLAPEDLGATPLDVADPVAEFGQGPDAGPIELSAADVVLLEPGSPVELELGGQPEDPVPLAGLHEFVGAQPEDPRALAFDDRGEQPTFALEDLQATEAELAAEPDAFQHAPLEDLSELLPEPVPEPPPPPAAPRFAVPRPPAAPPPVRPAAAAIPPPAPPPPSPQTRASAAAPPVARPPPPPPAAYVLSDDGRRLPALSPAPPEPPELAHQFGGSGPFVRNKVVLLAQARLDVMEDADGVLPDSPAPPPAPATDVATGAEVFGGAYLSPTFVEGEHRVVLHTLEGQVRRGTVKDIDLLDPVIRLVQSGRPPEAIAAERVKAIFFMQEPGTAPPPSVGRRIRVGFADGRQIVGFSEDVDAGEQGFFLVPADTRTHTARIYVFRAGVQSISAA